MIGVCHALCIAGDFTKYDEYAVKQINRNIDLVRYKKFGEHLLFFELINSNVAKPIKNNINQQIVKQNTDKTFEEQLNTTAPKLRKLYYSLRDYIVALGDDIIENQLKFYVAFKKIKNIICIEVYQKQILVHLRINPDTIALEDGFTRDMRGGGHFGTGDLQIIIKSIDEFEKAKKIIEKAYEEN